MIAERLKLKSLCRILKYFIPALVAFAAHASVVDEPLASVLLNAPTSVRVRLAEIAEALRHSPWNPAGHFMTAEFLAEIAGRGDALVNEFRREMAAASLPTGLNAVELARFRETPEDPLFKPLSKLRLPSGVSTPKLADRGLYTIIDFIRALRAPASPQLSGFSNAAVSRLKQLVESRIHRKLIDVDLSRLHELPK